MTTPDEVRDLDPSEYDRWTELVADSPMGSVYAMPDYLDVLCRASGGRFTIRAALKGEEVLGGIGLYREGRGIRAVSVPRLLLFYNGAVLRRYTTRYPGEVVRRHLRILAALEESLRRDGPAHMVLRSRSPLVDVRPFLGAGWVVKPGYTFVVPIRDPDELWSRMDQNQRRLVDRAEAHGLHVTEDDDFDAFFALHREVHERKGAPLYLPEEAFRRYTLELRAAGRLRMYHARLPGGEPASSQLVLIGEDPVTHTVAAASAEAHHRTGASPFLRWKVFRALAADGYEANDLSGGGGGSVGRFKAQLGGELEAVMEVSRTRRGHRLARWPARLRARAGRVARRLVEGGSSGRSLAAIGDFPGRVAVAAP